MATIREVGLLADAVYNDNPEVAGWVCPSHQRASGRWDGFQAATFTKGGITVIAFRGTAQGMDVGADARLGIGMNTAYFSEGEAYAAAAAAPGDNIYVCGHSLGGAIAQVVANRGGYKMVTFNAPGVAVFASRNLYKTTPVMQVVRIGGALVSTFTNPQQTWRDVKSSFRAVRGINIRLTNDAVSSMGVHYGKVVTISGPSANPLTEHRMTTMNEVLARNSVGALPLSTL
jgi:pimeloyl-ACP methyl ester carboxylesterase